jgi:hypothetical protein
VIGGGCRQNLSRGSIVCVVTRLRQGRSGVRNSVAERNFSLLQPLETDSAVPQSFLLNGNLDSLPRSSGRCVELSIHLHLLPRLRISGAIPLSPIRLHGVDRENFTSFD